MGNRIGTDIVPTYFYGVSLRDAFILWFFPFVFTAPVAHLITIAPKCGMRRAISMSYSEILLTIFLGRCSNHAIPLAPRYTAPKLLQDQKLSHPQPNVIAIFLAVIAAGGFRCYGRLHRLSTPTLPQRRCHPQKARIMLIIAF